MQEGESEGGPFATTTKVPSIEPVPTPEPICADLVAILDPTLANPAIEPRPSSVEEINTPSEDATTIANLVEKVVN